MPFHSRKGRKKTKKRLKKAAKWVKRGGKWVARRNPYGQAAEFIYRGPKGYWQAKKKEAKWIYDRSKEAWYMIPGTDSPPKATGRGGRRRRYYPTRSRKGNRYRRRYYRRRRR